MMKTAALKIADRPSRRTSFRPELCQVFLHQGGLVCTAEPTIITTILGSCVAVCLWDSRRQQAGMNHFVLPDGGAGGDPRYGDHAVDALINAMLRAGSLPQNLVAKVFGGASTFTGKSDFDVGRRNTDMALARLEAAGISVVGGRTGGSTGVLIRMESQTGNVWARRAGS